MAGCSKSMDVKLEHHRISGSGIRGHDYHDDKWVIKKNAILAVKCNAHNCLCPYTISRSTESDEEIHTDVGRIHTDLQKVLRRFLNSDEDSEIKMKVTSTIVDESKRIIPAYIELYGRTINKVTNALTAIKEKIKEINKKPEYQGKAKISIRKIPLKDKNKANEQTDEGATSLQDAEGDTNVSLNEEDNTEVKTLVNDAGDSLKRKQSDAEMLTDEPACKQMKRITSTSSSQNKLKECDIKDQKGAEGSVANLNEDETKTFIFRLQYLLVEIGAPVLRNVIYKQVKGDFGKHLKSDARYGIQLSSLLRSNKIEKTQHDLLCGKDLMNSLSKLDITSLVCLLRNVCGLKHHKDTVWNSPDPTNVSVEANICRLRKLRNEMWAHNPTVHISNSEYNAKWEEIKKVIVRIDKQYGNGDILSKIDAAETVPLDKKLKADYDEMGRKWAKNDEVVEDGIEFLNKAQQMFQQYEKKNK